jgi:hypothetical protein
MYHNGSHMAAKIRYLGIKIKISLIASNAEYFA